MVPRQEMALKMAPEMVRQTVIVLTPDLYNTVLFLDGHELV